LFDEDINDVISDYLVFTCTNNPQLTGGKKHQFSFVVNETVNSSKNIGLAIYSGLHGHAQNTAVSFAIEMYVNRF
jgi:hypothetical protein